MSVLLEATSVMSTLITAVGSFVTGMIGWAETVLGAITTTGNEVLLLFVVAIPVSAFAIGTLRRLISL